MTFSPSIISSFVKSIFFNCFENKSKTLSIELGVSKGIYLLSIKSSNSILSSHSKFTLFLKRHSIFLIDDISLIDSVLDSIFDFVFDFVFDLH